ncbi:MULTISPECIES: GGDEF domain-containing protein [Delftia]|uniref:diguanylate cyclase n=3 Tax=Delftia TaxID=80865 RepID=A0A1H3SZP8_9BURK|nr:MULTISPECIES: GGDEF domain-containing protein [Delftia]MXN28901.1 diguanylate cyclase [Delftia sp. CH05]OJX14134.1 MAG: GGDEF domain-containing protein [Delftia sp. 67-8]QRI88229.1 GGDEF domain-containing protein [Delftia lacustris]KAF1041654.1 MAG: putative diguanylate cyclase DgcT [Delftia tsuruhatensis]MCR4544070.1 GGDEF domain-containing protein [Delftia tsuruhatensis]
MDVSLDTDRLYVLIAPLSILLLSCTLAVCWLVQRRQRYLLWIAGGYALVSLALAWQSIAPREQLHHWAVYTGAMYLFGTWCFARCMAGRYGVSAHPVLGLLIGAVVLAALYYYSRIQVDLWVRVHWLNTGLGLLQLLPAPAMLRRRPPQDWLERMLYWSYVVFAGYTAARPLLVLALGSTDLNEIARSTYWLVTLVSTLSFALLFTLMLLACTVRDVFTALRQERNHDSLTNLLNRRAFQEAAELRLADSHMAPVSVLIGDIDHFKRINDSWGHDCGDRVLQAVARTLQQHVRSDDLVSRFGGEEFVLLLMRTTPEEAERVAERIRAQLSADGYVLAAGQRITISFGIAPVAANTALTDALTRADALLYSAKQAGRDRVHVAADPGRKLPQTA